jgi:hypothetical protein
MSSAGFGFTTGPRRRGFLLRLSGHLSVGDALGKSILFTVHLLTLR